MARERLATGQVAVGFDPPPADELEPPVADALDDPRE